LGGCYWTDPYKIKEEITMADEVQAAQTAEGAAPAAPEGAQAAAKKPTKINRMDAGALASKIEEIEKINMTGSKYYKHLLQRKQELGA
jgi:hypothetical protein